MKVVWAAVYVGCFLVVDVVAVAGIQVTGLGVAVTKAILTGQRVTLSQAYQTLNTVDTIIAIVLASVVTIALWSVRHPGALQARLRVEVQRAKSPSTVYLVVIWVVAVCTVVGYPVAIYATWRYATGHRAGAVPKTITPLAARLAQLESAREAGLITAAEHADKRTALIQEL